MAATLTNAVRQQLKKYRFIEDFTVLSPRGAMKEPYVYLDLEGRIRGRLEGRASDIIAILDRIQDATE